MMAAMDVPTGQLKAHPKNSRKHSPEQVRQIARSMDEFGWTQPILADEDGTILIGHGRWEAAKSLGQKTVPVIFRKDLSDADKRALIISDNRLAEAGSSWDEDVLQAELKWLVASSFDISLTGFDMPELGRPPEEQTGATVEPVCEDGDVWRCGLGVVVVADGDPDTLTLIHDGENPNVVMGWVPEGMGWEALALALTATKASTAYLLHEGTDDTAGRAAVAAGYQVRAQIVIPWTAKAKAGGWRRSHIVALYCARKADTGKWMGGRKQDTLWRDMAPKPLEPGDIPDEVAALIIANHTDKGDVVWAPWETDGTVLIAAHQQQRRSVLFIADRAQADKAIMRWEALTGRDATLATTGETHHGRRKAKAEAGATAES